MNTLEKAEIPFEGRTFWRCKIGAKKIPPPIPMIPAKKPSKRLIAMFKYI